MMILRNDDKVKERALNIINNWRADWNCFIRDGFGVVLDREQQEILSAVQHNRRVSVASGTARGKDFVAACAGISFLYLTPRWNKDKQLIENTKVALTAPTDRQVKNIMMPEISRLFNRAKHKGIILPGKLNAYDIRTGNEEWFLTGFKADEHNHEAWSGFHAVNTMFIVTEASGVADTIFDAIEGNLQGNSRIFIVFNPNTTVGYAARSQKEERWEKFRLNSLTAPNVKQKKNIIPGQVDYEWVKDKIENWCTKITKEEVKSEMDDFLFERQWYRPEDLFRVKVLGKFPKVPENILIPVQWIEEAQARWKSNYQYNRASLMLGVDVAGMGRDSTVFVPRYDNYVAEIKKHNSGGVADHMETAGSVVNELDQNLDGFASIDTIGEGAGTYSRTQEFACGSRVISCKYSESAKDEYGEPLKDITEVYEFANMRAYLFWCVRDWLNPKNNTGAMLPPGDILKQEATEIKWKFRSDGKIIIEPKEDIKDRLGRSPDEFDALANTFYPRPVLNLDVDYDALERMAY